MGRSWATEKTKCVLKPVKQWEQLGNMHNWKILSLLNKNPPNLMVEHMHWHLLCFKSNFFWFWFLQIVLNVKSDWQVPETLDAAFVLILTYDLPYVMEILPRSLVN